MWTPVPVDFGIHDPNPNPNPSWEWGQTLGEAHGQAQWDSPANKGQVLHTVQDTGLRANPKKSLLGTNSLRYLEHKMGQGCITPKNAREGGFPARVSPSPGPGDSCSSS